MTDKLAILVADIDAASRQRLRTEPFVGVDRGSMPADLATAETNAFRRLSPRRNRWPDVAAFDARAGELATLQAKVSEQIAELHARRKSAPAATADALAAWHLSTLQGEQAARPDTDRVDAIDMELRERQADLEGLDSAIGQVLADKAEFVAKHRSRLVKSADQAAADAHDRVLELVTALEAARQDLIDLRQSAVWAATYPAPEAGQDVQHALLATGLRQPVEQTLGVATQVRADGVWKALRADADVLRNAATPEQKALMLGRDPAPRATWNNTPEGREQDRRERQEALARYRAEWGRDPE